ncbi:MAG TPA: SagB/ThcOx family dehydrogenase [Methanomassiliicoccales archaeon]|nr:SagB/ThcOx family dehydrogenase [Methanomassiliicoccales archaeon]
MSDEPGREFQRETKHRRDRLVGRRTDWDRKPGTYKEYPDRPRTALPEAKRSEVSLDALLRGRHSVRLFSEEAVSMEDLSSLLWSCDGITRRERGYEFRTAPSAGALYPVETYVAVNNVEGAAPGIYHYSVKHHALEQIRKGHLGEELARAALDQGMCASAPLVFIWTAVFERSRWKYGERAYRYVYLDAGHMAQNLALAAVSLGLGSCQIAATFDDEVNELLGVDGEEESVLYMGVVGRPEPGVND